MEKVNQEPVIDYEAAITAAQSLHGYRQGAGACVAFAKGAEWQARQASAAPQVAQPQPLTDEQILACVQSVLLPTPIGLTRDRGPYEVTEPSFYLKLLVRAIERAHGIGQERAE